MKVDLLQKLNQRIALETLRIGEQKKRVQELKREGHDTAEAEEILDALEDALEDIMAERDKGVACGRGGVSHGRATSQGHRWPVWWNSTRTRHQYRAPVTRARIA